MFIFSHLYVCQTSRHTETLTDGQRVHLCAHVPGGQGSTASDVCTSDEQRVLMLHCTRRAARTSLCGPLLLPVPFKTQKNRPLTAHWGRSANKLVACWLSHTHTLKFVWKEVNTSATMTTFDDILEEAGKFGRCQKRIFALLCMVSMPWAGVYVGIVFQGFTPDHWCRDPEVVERRRECGWSLADSRRLTVPLVNSSGVPQQSTCEQYEVDWNRTGLSCDSQELDLSRTPTAGCKNGWEYDYEGRQSFVTEVREDPGC